MLWGKRNGQEDVVNLVVREPMHRAYWPPDLPSGHHDADAGRCEPRQVMSQNGHGYQFGNGDLLDGSLPIILGGMGRNVPPSPPPPSPPAATPI